MKTIKLNEQDSLKEKPSQAHSWTDDAVIILFLTMMLCCLLFSNQEIM